MDPKTICRWVDKFCASREATEGSYTGRLKVTLARKKGEDVNGMSKLQLFSCDPESIKYLKLCYFIPKLPNQS